MELIIFLLLFSSFAYAIEQAKKEWRHHRDSYTQDIKRNNPDWHPRKIRRHARRRACTWWAMETAKGFPAIRRAWAEDRDHVKFLRENDRISRETRIEELRSELDAIRRGREEHEKARASGNTRLPFGTWYQEHAPRIRQGEPGPAQEKETGLPVSAPPPIEEARPPVPPGGSPVLKKPRPGYSPLSPWRPGNWAGDELPAKEDTGPSITQELDAIVADADGGAPQAPGQPAGTPNRDNDNEGDGMPTSNVPNGELTGDSPYRAAFNALEQYDQVAQQHEQSAETLEAQMTMHGFDRDPQLMEHIRGLRETATQIRTRTESARQTLSANHSQGDEYHTSGHDANASAFRNG